MLIRQESRVLARRIDRLAAASGLKREYAEDFLNAYQLLSNPHRHAGRIPPGSVTMIQLTAPIQPIADLVKDYLLFGPTKSVISAYEAIQGETLRGEDLDATERVIWVLGMITAFVPGPSGDRLSTAADIANTIYGSAKKISSAMRRQVQRLRRLGWQGDPQTGSLAALAVRADVPPRAMLILAGRLSRLRWERLRSLIRRFERARRSEAFTLSRNEQTTLERAIDVYNDFLEAVGRASPPEKFRQRSRLGKLREAGRGNLQAAPP